MRKHTIVCPRCGRIIRYALIHPRECPYCQQGLRK